MSEEKVSVVYPIYGDFAVERLMASIKSALRQENEKEIIVSEQGPEPRFEPGKIYDGETEIKYVFNKFTPSKEVSDYNTGKIRNDGVKRAEGKYVFSNDADIFMKSPEFLGNLVELKEKVGKVLYRPPMRRIPEEEFEQVYQKIKEKGIDKTFEEDLDMSKQYLATLGTKEWALKTFKKDGQDFDYEKTFTAFKKDFERYVNDPEMKGKEPMFWDETRYCGGIFFEREEFESVGGYCEKFINWGCEDSDLQYKFKEEYGIHLIPEEEKYEVIHFDHPKGYFSSDMWKRNEEIEEKRRSKDIEEIIAEDKKRNGL